MSNAEARTDKQIVEHDQPRSYELFVMGLYSGTIYDVCRAEYIPTPSGEIQLILYSHHADWTPLAFLWPGESLKVEVI